MDRSANPEALWIAPPDLSGGIPASLWTGSDAPTRERPLAEHGRQLAAAARQPAATEARRQESLSRILARHDAHQPAARLRRLQSPLIEAAAVAGSQASPPDCDPHDASASQTEEP